MRPRLIASLLCVLTTVALTVACAPAPTPTPPTLPPTPTLPTPTLPTPTPPSLPPPTTTTTTTVPADPDPGSHECDAATDVASQPLEPLELADAAGTPLSAESAAVDAGEAVSSTTTGLVTISTLTDGEPTAVAVPAAEAPQRAAELAADPGTVVLAADPEERVAVSAVDTYRNLQWGFDNVAFEDAWVCSTGAGVNIAVIDTGVQATHADLNGRVTGGVTFMWPIIEQLGTANVDPNGHGTHVAGTAAATANNGLGVAGVAPDATIIPVRVLGTDGSGYMSDVANGITWAVNNNADVINLSLGSSEGSVALANAVTYAETNGVVVVVAAGNTAADGNTPSWPAAYPTSLAVGSFDVWNNISWFSTTNAYVDVTAPGSSIYSTLPDGGYNYKSGTSMAAPHVAGLAALLVDVHPGDTPAQIRDRLTSTAVDMGAPGKDNTWGWGKVDPVAALTQ